MTGLPDDPFLTGSGDAWNHAIDVGLQIGRQLIELSGEDIDALLAAIGSLERDECQAVILAFLVQGEVLVFTDEIEDGPGSGDVSGGDEPE